MTINNEILRLLVVAIDVAWINGFEYCPNTLLRCSDYCCSNIQCCSSCSRSLLPHPECYSYSYSVPAIAGGILSSLTVMIIVSIVISICCGCICSERTGIQRRGRIFHDGTTTVTVISQTPSIYPNGYPQGQNGYPHGHIAYSSGQCPYPQASYNYPVMQPGISCGQPAPPYYAYKYQGNPPAYNMAFVPDQK